MTIDIDRFNQAVLMFDAINAQDPNVLIIQETEQPKELVYGLRMSEMLNRYAPDASEALKLAARCQHVQRWAIPRSDFPMTKPGYMQWRTKLKDYHAEIASQVMADCDYDADTIAKVASLLKKEKLKTDADMQTLEDVIVLAFLEHDLDAFVQKYSDYPEEKFLRILRKSYMKMSEKGQAAALTLITIPEHLMPVVQKAVS